ncbi:MAG: superoxide dismutase, partial [Patescibacteria group bacterium]
MLLQKPLPYETGKMLGISEKTLAIHYDKLYAGYIKKAEEISSELMSFAKGERDLAGANQTYSPLRALKHSEAFARNGVYLHETYFESMTPDSGDASGPLVDNLKERYGSLESFLNYFSACGMAARGWTVLACDSYAG